MIMNDNIVPMYMTSFGNVAMFNPFSEISNEKRYFNTCSSKTKDIIIIVFRVKMLYLDNERVMRALNIQYVPIRSDNCVL